MPKDMSSPPPPAPMKPNRNAPIEQKEKLTQNVTKSQSVYPKDFLVTEEMLLCNKAHQPLLKWVRPFIPCDFTRLICNADTSEEIMYCLWIARFLDKTHESYILDECYTIAKEHADKIIASRLKIGFVIGGLLLALGPMAFMKIIPFFWAILALVPIFVTLACLSNDKKASFSIGTTWNLSEMHNALNIKHELVRRYAELEAPNAKKLQTALFLMYNTDGI